MTQRLLAAILAVWMLHISLGAQTPTFSMPIINEASVNSIISIPVTVSNFDSIVSIGMVFRWDTSVLRYIGVSGFNLADLDAGDFGAVNALSDGELRLVWWLFTPTGQSLADDTELFKIRFRTVSTAEGLGTPIEITELDPSLLYEIQKVSGATYSLPNTANQDGFVAVGYTVVTEEPYSASHTLNLVQNPVLAGSPFQLVFDNKSEATTLSIQVYDLAGKLLQRQTEVAYFGKSSFEIETYNLKESSLVLLLVETSEGARFWKKAIISL